MRKKVAEGAQASPRPWRVEDRRGAPLKNIRVMAGTHEVAQVADVHQRDHLGGFRGNHAAADAVDAVGLANAALICKAVNRLEAYERLAEVASRIADELQVWNSGGDDRSANWPESRVKRLRAALAAISETEGGMSARCIIYVHPADGDAIEGSIAYTTLAEAKKGAHDEVECGNMTECEVTKEYVAAGSMRDLIVGVYNRLGFATKSEVVGAYYRNDTYNEAEDEYEAGRVRWRAAISGREA